MKKVPLLALAATLTLFAGVGVAPAFAEDHGGFSVYSRDHDSRYDGDRDRYRYDRDYRDHDRHDHWRRARVQDDGWHSSNWSSSRAERQARYDRQERDRYYDWRRD